MVRWYEKLTHLESQVLDSLAENRDLLLGEALHFEIVALFEQLGRAELTVLRSA